MSPEQQLENELTLMMLAQEDDGLDGFDEFGGGLGFHKKIKKGFKRYTKSIKNTIKNPGAAIKRRVKRTVKLAKKVAPYAVAGAAMYFAAPYALLGAKYLGAKAMGLKAMMSGGGALPEGQMGPPAPASSFMSPEVLSYAGGLAKMAMKRQGVNVQSPQAQRAIQQYVDSTAMRAQQGVVPGGTGTELTKYLIPAAAGVAAILMLKG